MVMLPLILAITVFFNLVTNKNSSAISRRDSLSLFSFFLRSLFFHFNFWFGFIGVDCQCRVVSNFALSFSIISVLTGITTLYNTGLNYGGPVSMQYGWFLASAFTMLVALSMAEICSAFPTSGGLYYWSAKLAGPKWSPFASWITGW
jgi:hypothetical protein